MIYTRFGSPVEIVGFTPASEAPDNPETDWFRVFFTEKSEHFSESYMEYPIYELRADRGIKEICDAVNALPADKRFNRTLD